LPAGDRLIDIAVIKEEEKKILGKKGEHITITDNGGTRTGSDRRKSIQPYDGNERRSGRDRRKGFDRRSGLARRRAPDRRSKNGRWDGSCIERRDSFRK
jgi:hypothetical protein